MGNTEQAACQLQAPRCIHIRLHHAPCLTGTPLASTMYGLLHLLRLTFRLCLCLFRSGHLRLHG